MANLGALSLDGVNWLGAFGDIIVYAFYAMVLAVFGAVAWIAMHFMSFKYKVYEFEVVGSGSEDAYSIGKMKRNRFKYNSDKSAWLSLYPLFNKKQIEPFEQKFIYIGNTVFTFKIGEDYVPGSINLSRKENKFISEINPIPYSQKQWALLEIKSIEEEFQKQDFWAQNKYMVAILITAGICTAMCLGTIWLAFEFATGGTSAVEGLTSAINNIGTIK